MQNDQGTVEERRATLREEMKRGEVSLKHAAGDYREIIAGEPVREVLEALPGWDEAKAVRMMEELDIQGGVRFENLDEHQLHELIKRVGDR